MELLFSLRKEKKNKSIIIDIKLMSDGDFIEIYSDIDFHYFKNIGVKKVIAFNKCLTIDLKTGDIIHKKTLKNDENTINTLLKKNDFKEILEFTEKGIINGEKTLKFWGVMYQREIRKLYKVLVDVIQRNGFIVKEKDSSSLNYIYDLIVDFHLYKKEIKGHDLVYHHILKEYPRKKWLKNNDNKFLPAVLDSYGIKSKSLLNGFNKYMSENYVSSFHFRSLKFVCTLFGEDYPHYISQIPSVFFHCGVDVPNMKTYQLKDASEKKRMVELFKNWENDYLQINPFIKQIHTLLEMRDFLEKRGFNLKFNVTNDIEFLERFNEWYSFKSHYTRGFKLMISYSDELIEEVQKDIIIDGITYRVFLLKSEDDFRLEGHRMKNCMGNQFIHGLNSTFFAVIGNNKRYHVQFKDGEIRQIHGKANQVVPPGEMDGVITELSIRLTKFYETKVGWDKIKYNFVF